MSDTAYPTSSTEGAQAPWPHQHLVYDVVDLFMSTRGPLFPGDKWGTIQSQAYLPSSVHLQQGMISKILPILCEMLFSSWKDIFHEADYGVRGKSKLLKWFTSQGCRCFQIWFCRYSQGLLGVILGLTFDHLLKGRFLPYMVSANPLQW